MATSKLKARGKPIATKHPKFSGYEPASKPSVKIMKCIGFQKFRYCNEKRPGKKYQDKDFLQLALCHMSGKNVRVQIACFDTEKQSEMHPNGLVGRDCECGVYNKVYPITKSTEIKRIPYLRTERILTKKANTEEGSNMKTVFEERARILPSPYKEKCLQQSTIDRKYDTTRVRFGVIVTIEDSLMEPIFSLSNVVQNASEKTMLRILKLSTQFVSAQEGGEIDIFTSEDGPPITAGKCTVKVIAYDGMGEVLWESPEHKPTVDQILYKRVVTYKVPAYCLNPATDSSVRGVVSLSCMQSGQNCSYDFCYEPGADSARKLSTIHSNKPLRKRPYVSEPTEDEKFNDSIKLRVKEKVKSRQNQAESAPVLDLTTRPELSQSTQPVVVSNGVTNVMHIPTNEQDSVPLHQQEDIVLAKDLYTGEVVYIRTPQSQNSSDMVVYVHDAPQTINSSDNITILSDTPRAVAVPASEWNSGASTSMTTPSSTTIRILESVGQQARRPSYDQAAGPSSRKKKYVSPWIVDEPESTPLINGDISFTQPKTQRQVLDISYPATSAGEAEFKREPSETGPPILTPGQGVQITNDTVPGMSNNLPSGMLISSANLPSLGSLLANGVLEGVKFDETGNLLSSSVFEMVRSYM